MEANVQKKGHLTILTTDRKVKQYIVNSIRDVIGSEINIAGISTDEMIMPQQQTDLVLTSGEFMKEAASEHFPGVPVLYSKRAITGHNLEHVIMTPKGQRALVVVHPQEASDDTIKSLRKMGIDHLDYESFWKGKEIDVETFDLAITPGMSHLCPPGIKKTIDIGERTISIQTFAKILLHFDLDMKYLDIFEQIHSRQLVDAGRKVQRALEASEKLRGFQDVILQNIDEGILMLDEDDNILLYNQNTTELFGEIHNTKHSPSLQGVLDSLVKEDGYIAQGMRPDSSGMPSILMKHRNKELYCSKYSFVNSGIHHSLVTFKNVEQIQMLEQSVRRKQQWKGFSAKYNFTDLWGSSERMQRTKELAMRFAQTDQTILITGESGTGKELFAQSIHNASKRAKQPFVAINLGAMPESLMESELFGYVEGAFTGAKKSGKMGMFELAHGGTIFLDEIGDAPGYIQVRLLRVLEEHNVTRVGAEENTPVDIRVICATNKSLSDEVLKGTFRSDLFYRLNVLPIPTIPLRDFRNEIPDFITRQLDSFFSIPKTVEPFVMDTMKQYKWPGNFRELRNVVEYMYHSSGQSKVIGMEDIPAYMTARGSAEYDLKSFVIETPFLLPILKALKKVYPSSLGRGMLIEALQKQGQQISEGQAKKALVTLKERQLILTGTTKQGSSITELGVKVLQDSIL